MTVRPDYELEVDGTIATITFSDPATRNALTRETRIALVDDLRALDARDDVRVIILTGEDPSFTSGVNAKQLLSDSNYVPPPVDPATALRTLSTPVIAAVNGTCYSGGLEIALACSFMIASDRARFADTHAKIGITPGWGLSAELPLAVGAARARQLAFTGLPIDAATALDWGLINEVVPHETLLDRARDLAGAITELPQGALRNAVELYARHRDDATSRARAVEGAVLESWRVDRGESARRFGGSSS